MNQKHLKRASFIKTKHALQKPFNERLIKTASKSHTSSPKLHISQSQKILFSNLNQIEIDKITTQTSNPTRINLKLTGKKAKPQTVQYYIHHMNKI